MRKEIETKKILFRICMLLVVSWSIFVSTSSAGQITIDTNRMVVLDDPNTGTNASGFFDPSTIRGGNWNSDYWSGESTTIRATALVVNNSGSPQTGVTVSFSLSNPSGGTPVDTASSATNDKGIAYYSFDLNGRNYWGNWIIDASATVD